MAWTLARVDLIEKPLFIDEILTVFDKASSIP